MASSLPRISLPRPSAPKKGQTIGQAIDAFNALPPVKASAAPKWGIPLYARRPGRGIRSITPKTVTPIGGSGPAPAPGSPSSAGPGQLTPFAGNPYAGLPDWAQNQLRQIDADQKNHQQYASQVGNWLQGALTGLTGVDPAHPGLNATMQQQYLNNVGLATGALGQSAYAALNGPSGASVAPGGIMASPTGYLNQGAALGAGGHAQAMTQAAQVQSALNTMVPNSQAQAYTYAYADMQAGLPAVYAAKRAAARSQIDQFISQQQAAAAKLAESMRHNRVTEAISAQNAQNGLLLGTGRLGISASTAGAKAAGAAITATTPAPPGMVKVPNGSGGYRFTKDPTYVAPKAPKGAVAPKALTPSQITNMNGKWKGDPTHPPKLGSGWKTPVYDPGTGAWYAKKISGGGSTTATTVKPLVSAKDQQTLISDLTKAYHPPTGSTTDVSIASRHPGDPQGAGEEVGRWIYDRRNSFVDPSGKIDEAKLMAVLRSVGGPSPIPTPNHPTGVHGGVQWYALNWLKQHRTPKGTWK